MQLAVKHTAGNFVIQVIRSLIVFANQVFIMQNLTSLSLASVMYIAKKKIPSGRRKRLCIFTILLLCICLLKAKQKCLFVNDISQCHQIYESLREVCVTMNHSRKIFSSVMMNFVLVCIGLSIYLFIYS